MRGYGHLVAFVFGLALTVSQARATDPSPTCRDGAAHCREAYGELEKCQATHKDKAVPDAASKDAASKDTGSKDAPKEPEKDDGCAAARAATDNACRTSNSACDRDGSKRYPGRAHASK